MKFTHPRLMRLKEIERECIPSLLEVLLEEGREAVCGRGVA
jgi:hypothetical protein